VSDEKVRFLMKNPKWFYWITEFLNQNGNIMFIFPHLPKLRILKIFAFFLVITSQFSFEIFLEFGGDLNCFFSS